MNPLSRRTRRTRPAEPGKHSRAATAKTPAHLGGLDGEQPMIFRISDPAGGPAMIIPPEPMPSRAAQPSTGDRDDAQRHGTQVRPAVTASWQISAPAADVLQRFADGIRALPPAPGAFLRAIMPGGDRPWEPLNGNPVYAGLVDGTDGRRYAGLYLGDEDQDGRIVIDATRQYLLALRDIVDVALAAMGAEADEALTSLENDLDSEGRPAA